MLVIIIIVTNYQIVRTYWLESWELRVKIIDYIVKYISLNVR